MKKQPTVKRILTCSLALLFTITAHISAISTDQIIDIKAEQELLLDMVIAATDRASIALAIDELFNAETPPDDIKEPKEQLQPDISCFIADMKYDGQNLKILEFGEITSSCFRGHENLYGKGKIWGNLWHELASYAIPIWYIEPKKTSNTNKRTYDLATYATLGGQICPALEKLKQYAAFNQSTKKVFNKNQTRLNKHKGILVVPHVNRIRNIWNKFQREFPGYLILNNASEPFVNNKFETSKLFDDHYLKQFKPQWKAYKKPLSRKTNAAALAQQIIRDFSCDPLVIKPLDGANGWGVIIVKKQDLASTLNLIFSSDKTILGQNRDQSYSYWARDRNASFLIESYEQSKPITVLDKEYDATMRMVFVLANDGNQITLKFLGGYWKLPRLSLSEDGTLTEKHKSKIDPKRTITSAIISPEDTAAVQNILHNVLPRVYKKMLNKIK